MYYFANFCTVCLSYDEKLKRLSDTDADNIRLLEKLKYCSGEKVYENVPQFICNNCCNDLSRAYNFKKKVLASRNYLKSYLLKFLKHSDYNKYCCNVYVSLVDIKRARNLSNYMKQYVNNDPEVCDEESKNCSPETSTTPKDFYLLRRSCVENKETESYTQRKFNNEIRETLIEMIHTNVEYKKEKNEQEIERIIKEENIEIEEHNVDIDKYVLNKVNKKIKLEEEVEKEVQPTWVLKPVGSVDENKQERNDTRTEIHMPLNRYRREKDISGNEGSVFEESKIDIDEDFDDKALAKEEMIDISQISVNEKTSDENVNNYNMLREENPFSCEKCPQRCTTKEELEKGILLHKNKESNNLRDHVQIHRKVYSCKVCQRDFSLKANLKRHMIVHTGEKPFECNICLQRFTTKSNLKQHNMVIHNNEKPFSCHICNKQFRYKTPFRMHVRRHEDPGYRPKKYESVYTCSVCKRDFNQQGNLQKHMRIHTGEKPFECTICSQRFTTKYGVKEHMMVHTNEKPFSCQICNKRFRYKCTLRTHMRWHENPEYRSIKYVKVYTCTICQREFNHKPNLQRHMRTHTGEKPFECTICSQRFTAKHSVKKHMMIHANKKPLSSHICNKQFNYKNCLRKHVRCQHKDPKCSTATSTDTKDTSKNSEVDVMESQDGNKDRTQTVSMNMQKRREIYLRENMNAADLIVGLPLNETDEEVEYETVVRTVGNIKEETVQDVNEFNKPLKMKEKKDESEQNEFETVFVCC